MFSAEKSPGEIKTFYFQNVKIKIVSMGPQKDQDDLLWDQDAENMRFFQQDGIIWLKFWPNHGPPPEGWADSAKNATTYARMKEMLKEVSQYIAPRTKQHATRVTGSPEKLVSENSAKRTQDPAASSASMIPQQLKVKQAAKSQGSGKRHFKSKIEQVRKEPTDSGDGEEIMEDPSSPSLRGRPSNQNLEEMKQDYISKLPPTGKKALKAVESKLVHFRGQLVTKEERDLGRKEQNVLASRRHRERKRIETNQPSVAENLGRPRKVLTMFGSSSTQPSETPKEEAKAEKKMESKPASKSVTKTATRETIKSFATSKKIKARSSASTTTTTTTTATTTKKDQGKKGLLLLPIQRRRALRMVRYYSAKKKEMEAKKDAPEAIQEIADKLEHYEQLAQQANKKDVECPDVPRKPRVTPLRPGRKSFQIMSNVPNSVIKSVLKSESAKKKWGSKVFVEKRGLAHRPELRERGESAIDIPIAFLWPLDDQFRIRKSETRKSSDYSNILKETDSFCWRSENRSIERHF